MMSTKRTDEMPDIGVQSLTMTCFSAGSENNSLYLYYKGLSKTLLTFKFDTVKSVLDKDKKEDDTNEFVSAVCWRAMPDGVSERTVCQSDQWRFMSDILFICLRYS